MVYHDVLLTRLRTFLSLAFSWSQAKIYERFLGVQIKLKPGALRYTDVPGIAVTPVLGGTRDLGGQVRTDSEK